MKFILANQIKDGDILLADSNGFLARQIKNFQKMRFGKNSPYNVNHVGICILDKDGAIIVYEQDTPGKFQPSIFSEYSKTNIRIARSKEGVLQKALIDLRHDLRILVASDRLTNYNYTGLLGFALSAITGNEKHIKEPNERTVCSQIIAKLTQKHFSNWKYRNWWTVFPCEFAMNEEYEIFNLIR